jgi:hypothetical protein
MVTRAHPNRSGGRHLEDRIIETPGVLAARAKKAAWREKIGEEAYQAKAKACRDRYDKKWPEKVKLQAKECIIRRQAREDCALSDTAGRYT